MKISSNIIYHQYLLNPHTAKSSFAGNVTDTNKISLYFQSLTGNNLKLENHENFSALMKLRNTFNKIPEIYIVKAYTSCQDSNGMINPDALETLISLCKGSYSIKDKILGNGKGCIAYQKGGIGLISDCINAAKDVQNNHNDGNLEFVKKMLIDKTHSMLNLYYKGCINACKNDKGLITFANFELFKVFKESNLQGKFCELFGDKKHIKEAYRDFVLNRLDEKGKIRVKDLETIHLVRKSKDDEKILKEIQKYPLTEPSTFNRILFCCNLKNIPLTLDNFRILLSYSKEQAKVGDNIYYYNFLMCDNNGLIRHRNWDFIEKVAKKLLYYDKKDLLDIASIGKDKEGVIQSEFTNDFCDFLEKNPKFKRYQNDNLVCVLKTAKAPDNTVQFDVLNQLCEVYSEYLDISSEIDKQERNNESAAVYAKRLYEKILPFMKNKSGKFEQSKIEIVSNLQKDKLVAESFCILNMSQKPNGEIDKEVFNKVRKFLLDTDEKERKEMATFLETCKDYHGNFDDSKCKIVYTLRDLGVKSNVVKIAKALKNPDGTVSGRGLNLISDLKKLHIKNLDSDLHLIIKYCRDKNGKMDNNSISCVKKLSSYNPEIEISELLKIIKDSHGEISKSKLKTVEILLKNCKIEDIDTLEDLMSAVIDKKGNTDFDFLKIIVKIQKSGEKISYYKGLVSPLKAFSKYSEVKSVTQLNLRQKRDFMHKVTKFKNDICDTRFQKILDIPILPKNESEYCETVGKLSHYLGINVKPLNSTLKKEFFQTLKEMSLPNSEFIKLDFDNTVPKLELKYPLKDFQNDVMNQISKHRYSVRTRALDYFGFELKNNDGKIVMNGYPKIYKNNSSLKNIDDKEVLDVIKNLTPIITKFTQNNTVTVKNNLKLSKQLSKITEAFPEFLTTIGKPQHSTQDYTLDIHILKVLQNVFKNPEYAKLSETGKQQLALASLLHDITKSAGEIDSTHPQDSAFDVYYLLDKLNMEEKDKCKIYQLIKNHSWLANYNSSSNIKEMAKNIAFEFRQNDAFKLALMLTEADLKGVQKFDAFYKKHSNALHSAEKCIKPLVYELQKTTINLPQTKFPKANKLNTNSPYVKRINKDGVSNSVIFLKKGINLKKAGFAENVKLEDLNFLVHALDEKDSSFMFQSLGLINSNALLSSSYVNYGKGNFRAYRKQGFVLDVASTNIHVAYWRDFGSGYKKDKQTLFKTYLFKNNPIRNYFSDELKKELHLSNAQYINLMTKIEDMSISELDVKYPKIARAYRKIYNSMEVSKRTYGRNYNEILISRPKIQAVFCYDQQPENVPIWLRRYAQKNNIPLLVFD